MPDLNATGAGAILVWLLLAHLATDFFLQLDVWARHKRRFRWRSRPLYWHIGVATLTTFVVLVFLAAFTQLVSLDWRLLWVPLFIGTTHFFIDLAKVSLSYFRGFRGFILDQAAHLTVIFGAWLTYTHQWPAVQSALATAGSNSYYLSLLLAYLFLTHPAGILIKIFTAQWTNQLAGRANLLNAGRYIGWIERPLILTFILLGQYEPIGLLIAAKSILRFRDTTDKDSQFAEYLVVGTLASFAVAVTTGMLLKICFPA